MLLVCVGLVLGADELHPISWRVWARNAESVSRGGKGGPFRALEDRAGFVDIRVSLFCFFFSFAAGLDLLLGGGCHCPVLGDLPGGALVRARANRM